MTFGRQMSSRNPPVAQSTFGFPDDSLSAPGSTRLGLVPSGVPPKVNILSTRRFCPARLSTLDLKSEPDSSPVRALRSWHEAFSFPALCLCKLRGRRSRSPKNVEKLSFGPHRLACTSKAKKIFPPRFSTFPPPKTVQLFSQICASVSFGGGPFPFSSLCLSWFILPTLPNVEKLSFQPRVYLFLRESKNLFPPLQSALSILCLTFAPASHRTQARDGPEFARAAPIFLQP